MPTNSLNGSTHDRNVTLTSKMKRNYGGDLAFKKYSLHYFCYNP